MANETPPPEAHLTAACGLDELPERGFIVREIAGFSIVLCQIKGEVFAVENRCSHALATFDDGRLRGIRLMCPLHGACFDVRDGKALGAPATRPIRPFPVTVIEGRVWIHTGGNTS